jgi:hypothetical protein
VGMGDWGQNLAGRFSYLALACLLCLALGSPRQQVASIWGPACRGAACAAWVSVTPNPENPVVYFLAQSWFHRLPMTWKDMKHTNESSPFKDRAQHKHYDCSCVYLPTTDLSWVYKSPYFSYVDSIYTRLCTYAGISKDTTEFLFVESECRSDSSGCGFG